MLYVYLYLYTKHFSRLHSKAYICCVKIEGGSKLLRMALSFPDALEYLILDQQNVSAMSVRKQEAL